MQPTEIIADCSALMAMVLPDEGATLSEAELRMLVAADLCAPFVWPLEIAHTLRKCVRRKRITQEQADSIAESIEALGVQVVDNSAPFRRWLDLALAHDLSAYDCTYIDLALSSRRPLATCDTHLATAARRLGVRTLFTIAA